MHWCQRCEEPIRKFGVSAGVSLDYRDDQPDDPGQCDHDRWHLCLDCRDEFLEWVQDD